MTKNNMPTGIRGNVLSRNEREVYQRISGNEGPSPLMKVYLTSRKKENRTQPAEDEPSKTS